MTIEQAFQVALAHHQAGRLAEAEAIYRQILTVQPQHADALHLMGVIAHQAGRNDVALDLIRHAIALAPNFSAAYDNLGTVLREQGRVDEAIIAHRHATTLAPSDPETHYNLGNALKAKGQMDEAVASYRKAIFLDPHNPKTHYNLALTLLLQGHFSEGWEEYEWRWKWNDFPSPRRNFVQPQWDGDRLEERTVLLHAEQGFGDAILFIRYLPLVLKQGGKVVIECHPELQRLFQGMVPDVPVIARGRTLPPFDTHCPLLSLPRIFATDLTNIPNHIPYLRADAVASDLLRERLADHSAPFNVGLVWAGNPSHTNDRNRSLRIASLTPLAEVPGVRFFSLQKGDAATEAGTPPAGMELIDMAGQLNDFADTAAIIANLDLVITADTAVAHLAGAIGRPVWVLLPFVPDWRWMLEREDSQWYPTMRLFRQPAIADWDSVIRRAAAELAAFRT